MPTEAYFQETFFQFISVPSVSLSFQCSSANELKPNIFEFTTFVYFVGNFTVLLENFFIFTSLFRGACFLLGFNGVFTRLFSAMSDLENTS